MRIRNIAIVLLLGILLHAGVAVGGPTSAWVPAMKKVHADFKGKPGTFAHFGDSITYSLAFWSSLQWRPGQADSDFEASRQWVLKYMHKDCWRSWKGPKYGNLSGKTVAWANANIDGWLKKLNPEVVLIMFGTNDLGGVSVEKYEIGLRKLVQRCLDNGSVVILSTIPPRSGKAEKAAQYAEVARKIAKELKVPLSDFHAEVLKRRPNDWDGSAAKFKGHKTYEVPTLIAGDGVHPSNPKKWRKDFTEDGLKHNGFNLRSYITLNAYVEVMDKVLDAGKKPAARKFVSEKKPVSVSVSAQSWWPKAPKLGAPKGRVIKVSSVRQLFEATKNVRPGGTIMLAAGRYNISRRVGITTDRVTLRGATGNRDDVVIDGDGIGELVAFTACSDVTVADLTIQHAKWNGFKIDSETGVQRLRIYNCVIHNIWQRGVKGVIVPEKNRKKTQPRDCRIEYCLFYNDRPKKFSDDEADTPKNFGGNYVGAIDVMYAKGWTISDNVFLNIQGRTREGRGAVFLWHETEDCVVERNIIVDCDKGVSLGNSYMPKNRAVTRHARRCIVRNNFITRAPEGCIEAANTADCKIYNNTIHDPKNRMRRLLRVLGHREGLVVSGNIFSGPAPPGVPAGNLVKDLTAAFADPSGGNLHLKKASPEVVDKAPKLAEVTEDIDGAKRGSKPDLGADEL
ncbi:MAG: GDSL-type esterase/lipase family protein [Phycisphaerae bacterium]|jgi:lysophospholipase L1-like esterase|nr:GDSL-type esterase/lipase family protein [Phycisphaerae bacterium]